MTNVLYANAAACHQRIIAFEYADAVRVGSLNIDSLALSIQISDAPPSSIILFCLHKLLDYATATNSYDLWRV